MTHPTPPPPQAEALSPPESEKDSYSFLKHVFPSEFATIQARRQRLGRDMEQPGEGPLRPSTRHGLVGLALSGGGIRSATFNLGILQGLQEMGVLPYVDYLSTVSGGGYIGGAWSAYCHKGAAPFPFLGAYRTPEPPALRHLRSNANYLMMGGWVDGVRMAMVILRGIVMNFMLVIPWLIFMTVLTSLMYWPKLVSEDGEALPIDIRQFFDISRYVIPAYLGVLFLSPMVTRIQAASEGNPKRKSYELRNYFERFIGYGATLSIVVAFVEAQPLIVAFFHTLRTGSHQTVWAGIGSSISVVAALLARQQPSNSNIGQRVAMVAAGLAGPLIPLALYVLLSENLIYYNSDEYYTAETLWMMGGLLLYLYNNVVVNINHHSGHRFWRDRLSKSFLIAPSEDPNQLCKHVDSLRLSDLSQDDSDAPYHLLNTTLNLQGDQDMANGGRFGDFFFFSKHFMGGPKAGYIPTQVMEHVYPNVNLGTAMAISSAAAAPNMGTFTQSSLTIIMTLLNIRMGVWLAQPRQMVSELVKRGWLTPSSYPADEGKKPMGNFSFWRWQAGVDYLFREMMGAMDNSKPLINLSDGGHLENLGVYELLRRRCRYMIVGDGEEDVNMQFGSLAALIRYARIDLGIEIDVVLDDLQLLPDGSHGRQHCTLATIHYPKVGEFEAEQGVLLYFKASMTGDEGSMLTQYKSSSPAFPHESTADQFFSEAQFEAYRALGRHVVLTALREALPAPIPERKGKHLLMAMFRKLRVLLSPQGQRGSERFNELQAELGQILGENGPEAIAEYYAEIFPEVDDGSINQNRLQQDPIYRRRILDIVGKQLAFMESVYLEFDLHQLQSRRRESNSGWLALFHRWASSPSFRWASTMHAPSMSRTFRVFCQDVLGLNWGLTWKKLSPHSPEWFAPQPVDHAICLMGSITIAGQPLCVPESVVCVSFTDDGVHLRLSTHAIKNGFQSVDVYRLMLAYLLRLREESQLLPRGRVLVASPDVVLNAYKNDVDVLELIRELEGPTAAVNQAVERSH